MLEALRRFARYVGDEFTVEHPTGSGQQAHARRGRRRPLAPARLALPRPTPAARRPVFGGDDRFQNDPAWRDQLLFHEYFHGDTGAGLGASHQTGWTGLVADLVVDAGWLKP